MKIIILHDADARIELLDVADHLVGSDIEEFLSEQGFSVNNITWLAAPIDYLPVLFHTFDTDRDTGEFIHAERRSRLKDFSIHGQLQELKHREQEELKEAKTFVDRKNYTRLKKKIQDIATKAEISVSDELIKELDNEIKNVGAYV